MKKIFSFVIVLAAVAMVGCCGNQNKKAAEGAAACEQCENAAECNEQKACCEEADSTKCCEKCEKAEACKEEGKCCGDCEKKAE